MKKTLTRMGAVLLSGIMLAGCTGTENGSRGNYEGETPTPTKQEDPDAAPTPEVPDVPPQEERENGEWYDYFANGEVANNGHLMVRVGDRLYFRNFDPLALERTQNGTYFCGDDNPEYTSELMYYDIKADKTETLCTVNGTGALYATDKGFLLNDGDGNCTLITPDGSVKSKYYYASVLGVSDDGTCVAIISNHNSAIDQPEISITDGISTVGRLEAAAGMYQRFLGFAGNNLIASYYDEDEDITKIFSLGIEESGGILGEIPEYEGEVYPLSPEFYGFTSSGSEFALAYGYYDGSAHFLNASRIFAGDSESSGSLKSVATYDEDPYEKSLYTDETGHILWDEHAPDEVDILDGSGGDLICYTGPKDYETVYEKFTQVPEFDDSDAYDYADWYFLQEAFKSGDKVFALRARTYRNPDEDFGWRLAYNLFTLDYCMMDLSDMRDTGAVTYYMNCQTSSAWNQGGVSLEDIQGVWVCDYLSVEGQKMVPEDSGESYTFTISDKTAEMTWVRYDGTTDTETAEWITDDGPYYEGPYFEVPDDPSEQAYSVVCHAHNKIELFVSYVYTDGTYGSWYGHFHKEN